MPAGKHPQVSDRCPGRLCNALALSGVRCVKELAYVHRERTLSI